MSNASWFWLCIAGIGLIVWGFMALVNSGKDLMDENSEDHLE
jgi:hypothetical protein